MNISETADENDRQMREFVGWGAVDDTEADMKLISSDNWVFWVQSKKLAKASPVFKNMLETCKEAGSLAEIQLTDPHIESAANLWSVLYIVRDLIDRELELQQELRDSLDVKMLLLAQKYEMDSIIDATRLYLFELACSFSSEGARFVLVAAMLEEWNVCGRFVMALDVWEGKNWMEEEAHLRRMLDWRGWTPKIMHELSQVSDHFLWAVCRVGTKHARLSGQAGISYTDMGPDLARAMQVTPWNLNHVAEGLVEGDKSWWERPYKG